MWTISGVKTLGKKAYQRDYWKTVLMALVASFAAAGTAGGGINLSLPERLQYSDFSHAAAPVHMLGMFLGILGVGVLFVSLFAIGMKVFALNPLEVGAKRYMLLHTEGPASMGEIGFAFDHDYMAHVRTLFFRDLYVFLWSLLFVVPGIVKAYSYRLVPYILSEHPEMSTDEVLWTSTQLMKGNKGRAFWLDLSFIGWYLLTAVTCGIVGIFVVAPYKQMTDAYLFKAIAYPEQQEANFQNPYSQSNP